MTNFCHFVKENTGLQIRIVRYFDCFKKICIAFSEKALRALFDTEEKTRRINRGNRSLISGQTLTRLTAIDYYNISQHSNLSRINLDQ